MDNNLQIIVSKLQELKSASISSTPDTIRKIMEKYNMLFLGSKFNTVYSNELFHLLNDTSNFDITLEELNSLIPTACTMLNMNFEKLIALNDINKSKQDINYEIVLWA